MARPGAEPGRWPRNCEPPEKEPVIAWAQIEWNRAYFLGLQTDPDQTTSKAPSLTEHVSVRKPAMTQLGHYGEAHAVARGPRAWPGSRLAFCCCFTNSFSGKESRKEKAVMSPRRYHAKNTFPQHLCLPHFRSKFLRCVFVGTDKRI